MTSSYARIILPMTFQGILLLACGGGSSPAAEKTAAIYTITASAATGGTIAPSGTLRVSQGTSTTFTITASSGYAIGGVTVDGASQGATGTYTFPGTTTGAHTISASFSPVTPPTVGKNIVGYVPNWTTAPAGGPNNIQYSKLTHINYAFATTSADGNVFDCDTTTNSLTTIVSKAHAAGVKVLISVGGGSNKNNLTTCILDPTARGKLVTNVKNLVTQYHLDGIDLDWEGDASATGISPALEATLKAFHDWTSANGKLTTAALGGNWTGKAFTTNAVQNHLDFVNVMAYDDDSDTARRIDHASYQLALDLVKYWVNRGLPASKQNIGMPIYAWDGTTGSHDWTEVPYCTIVGISPAAAYTDFYGTNNYNGIGTVVSKAKYALDNAGGVMFWELNEDASGGESLLASAFTTLSGGSVPVNLAPKGTGFTWSHNAASDSDGHRIPSTGINDDNLIGDVDCSNGTSETSHDVWEGAGVAFSGDGYTVAKVIFINGSVSGDGNGNLEANCKLQFTLDGTTWADSGWTLNSAYPYSAAANGATYVFTGTAKTAIKGARIVGQVRATGMDSSGRWSLREIQVIGY